MQFGFFRRADIGHDNQRDVAMASDTLKPRAADSCASPLRYEIASKARAAYSNRNKDDKVDHQKFTAGVGEPVPHPPPTAARRAKA